MEAVISESLFEKQKSSFDMLNRNWVFILLFSDIILSLLINMIHHSHKYHSQRLPVSYDYGYIQNVWIT